MTATIRNRTTSVLLVIAILIVSLAAVPARAAGGWTNLGNGNWVKTNSSGTIVEVRIDNDSDPYMDVQILTRSDGSMEWLGIDGHGGTRIDTWYYRYTSGAVYVYLDLDNNGKYEVHGYDKTGDGFFEWARVDVDRNGHADTWVPNSTSTGTSSTSGGAAVTSAISSGLWTAGQCAKSFVCTGGYIGGMVDAIRRS